MPVMVWPPIKLFMSVVYFDTKVLLTVATVIASSTPLQSVILFLQLTLQQQP